MARRYATPGAVGLCAGLMVPVFTIVSAAGLTLLVLLGVLVRVHDSLLKTMAARNALADA